MAHCLPPTWRGYRMWVEFVVCCLSCFERFFSGYVVFSTPQKPTCGNSSSIRNQVDEERLCGFANCKSLFISIYSSSYFTRLGDDNQRNVNQRKSTLLSLFRITDFRSHISTIAACFISQLLKAQTKYLGRNWRKSNMKTMSAIYQKVRHRLNDDWAYGNG